MDIRRRLLVALTLALCAAAGVARADCIDNGHYTIAALAEPLTGTRYPYTEDLVHHGSDVPVGDDLVVAYHDDLHWTKIQSGCAAFGEYNVAASAPINLLLRASFRLAYAPVPAAAPATRYEVQLRVGTSAADEHPRIAATETRAIGDHLPRSERFAATLQDLPAGNYVYSLWFRLLDGTPANHVTLQLQWITAQGVPNTFPSVRRFAAFDDVVRDAWQPVGMELRFRGTHPLEAVLQSAFIVDEAESEQSTLTFGWTIDDRDVDTRGGTIAVPTYLPSSEVVFDVLEALEPGEHVVRLYARSSGGAVRLRRVVTELVSFPVERAKPLIPLLAVAERNDPVIVTTSGSDVQPAAMSSVCGRWTKLLDLELEPADSNFSWTLSGYVETLGVDGSGYVQVGIEAEHLEPTAADPNVLFDARTDMGMFELQVQPGHDGAFFYGDCSKWGNGRFGNRMSLWLRRIEGCNDAPFGGTIVVGRRWLAMKLLPSEGPHLP
jgi:hypothetical protein